MDNREILKKIVADRIKDLMIENNLNTQQLADEINIPRTSISNWLNLRRTIQIDALIKVAEYFNVTTDYLLGREE